MRSSLSLPSDKAPTAIRWPATSTVTPSASRLEKGTPPDAISSVENITVTSSPVAPMVMGSSIALLELKLFTRTVISPDTVRSSIPITSIVPTASRAYSVSPSDSSWTSPTVAELIRIPRAAGLMLPSSRVGSPSPTKRRRSVPAATCRSFWSTKLRLPSRRITSAMFRLAPVRETAKTSLSLSLKTICRVSVPIATSLATAPPVLLIRRIREPPASTPPTSTSSSPLSTPATPSSVIKRPPLPSISLAL